MRVILALIGVFIINFSGYAQSDWDLKVLEDINLTRNFEWDKTMNALDVSADIVAIGIPVTLLSAGFIKDDAAWKKEGYNAALTTLATYSAGYILKKAVDRPRPFIDHPHIKNYKDYTGGSFPSGTTYLAFSSATTLSLSYPKWYVILPSAVYASAVGYSRLHLGAHYPSDVLAGAGLGIATGVASKYLNEWVRNEVRKKKVKRYNQREF